MVKIVMRNEELVESGEIIVRGRFLLSGEVLLLHPAGMLLELCLYGNFGPIRMRRYSPRGEASDFSSTHSWNISGKPSAR